MTRYFNLNEHTMQAHVPGRHRPAGPGGRPGGLGLQGPGASVQLGWVGFNSADTEFGNSLAAQLGTGLTDRQWALAVTMLRKYRRQIGDPPAPPIEELLANLEDEEAA